MYSYNWYIYDNPMFFHMVGPDGTDKLLLGDIYPIIFLEYLIVFQAMGNKKQKKLELSLNVINTPAILL